MSDIRITNPGCTDCDDDDDDDERGKRGKRGHRGPPGPAAAASGLLKFSGNVNGTSPNFLADSGIGLASNGDPLNYPDAIARSLRNLATNLPFFTVPLGGSMVIELLQNGVPVPGFVVTYAVGETGIKTVAAGPAAFAIGDTFAVRVTSSGFVPATVVLATVGVE